MVHQFDFVILIDMLFAYAQCHRGVVQKYSIPLCCTLYGGGRVMKNTPELVA